MSALDDAITLAKVAAAEHRSESLGAVAIYAREELELLRSVCFECIDFRIDIMDRAIKPHIRAVLRTDPERAKRMGLGWAL